jgi:hypothetical protein
MQDYTQHLLDNNDLYINPSIGNHRHTITTNTITTNTTSTGTGTTIWTDGSEWSRPDWVLPVWWDNAATVPPVSGSPYADDQYWKKISGVTWTSLGLDKGKVLELISLMCILITEHGISPKIIFDIHKELMDGKNIENIIRSLQEALNETEEEKDFEKELDNILG